MSREELEEEGPPLSTKEVRLATVLRDMPYAISFSQRVLVFHDQVTKHKNEHQGDRVNFMQGPAININVRRNYLYEDAFEKLSADNGKYKLIEKSFFAQCSTLLCGHSSRAQSLFENEDSDDEHSGSGGGRD